ncbi:ankyrin repeat and sterile alpha motif domain-containing protein 1b, partial [Plakobranchus ocellatus]
LLRGSVVGTPRDVRHQFEGSNDTAAAAAIRSKKRKSTRSTFAPVMEEDKDIDVDKLMKDIDKINLDKRQAGDKNESDDAVFEDFSDDWDQIAETISSYGGKISSTGDYAFFEAQIDHLLSGKGDNKIQSVGSWLSDIGLAQYENTLVANGFDDTDFLGGSILEDADLEHIGIYSADHRHAIIEAAKKLPAVQSIDPDNPPATVAEWLGSLRLDYYFDTFMSHKFDSMNRVIQLWELELVTVLDITSVGHRKRILASLGEKRPDPNISPARIRTPSYQEPTRSPFDHVDLYRDYTGARSRVNDAGSVTELGQGSLLEYSISSNGSVSEGQGIRDEALHLRAPNLMHETGSIKQWRHKPEILIKGCCNYTAHYLGSTLVKELKGAMSTQEGIAKLKKSSAVISKIPTIMLSISFKGVKFIDAISKKVVCDHEIANIFCACQDSEHMNFFAYITKDRQANMHYCHVFSVRSRVS